MARWIVAVPAWTAGAVLLLPSPVLAQTGPSPASLARIRAALAEPPTIFQAPVPSSDVHERPPPADAGPASSGSGSATAAAQSTPAIRRIR